MNPYHRKRTVCGVDFSGAQDAGKRIWIACGDILDGAILISECFPAKDLQCSGQQRDQAIGALRAFMRKERDCTFGLDFPFGIPRVLVAEESWEEWLGAFPERYAGPEGFIRQCHLASNGKELKRATDVETKTPFSPYNLRLFRQTFFGVKDLLRPLIQEKAVCVLPFQKPQGARPWIIEVCPASTLRKEGLGIPYKGSGMNRRAAREKILRGMEKTGVVKVEKTSVHKRIIENSGGDALDSVIAAYATCKAMNRGLTSETSAPYAVEGRVYV